MVCIQRYTVIVDIPVAANKVRALQWVMPSIGLACRTRLITLATIVLIGALPAGNQFVMKPLNAKIEVTLPPFAHR